MYVHFLYSEFNNTAIPATRAAEIGRIVFPDQSGQKVSQTPHFYKQVRYGGPLLRCQPKEP
jgi:hypothetical protein